MFQTRGFAGFRFVNTRRMRPPRVGRLGKASTCSRSLRLCSGRPRPFLFERPKAGEIDGPFSGVGQQRNLRSKVDEVRAVIAQYSVDALNRGRIAGNAAQHVFARAGTTHFVHAQLGPLLRHQEFAVLRGKIEREVAEEKNLAALQQLAPGARLGVALLRTRPARRPACSLRLRSRAICQLRGYQ